MTTKEHYFMTEAFEPTPKTDPEYLGRLSEEGVYAEEPVRMVAKELDPNESTESWFRFNWSWLLNPTQPQR